MTKEYDKVLEADVFTSNEVQASRMVRHDNIYEIVDSYIVDDTYNASKMYGISMFSSTVDIAAHGLVANGALTPGQTNSFSYYITNNSSKNFSNVQYQIIINNQVLGTITIGSTLLANTQYRITFNLNGLSAGTYNMTVNVDPNNNIPEDTNKANNITSATFIVQAGLPDLTVSITSPTSSILPGVQAGSASQLFRFRIDNIGVGASPANVYAEVQADGSPIYSFYIDQGLASNSGGDGQFSLLFATYKPTEIKIIIDPSNRIPESNKSNNSHARTYTPDFCLHKWQPNTKLTGEIGVQVVDTALFDVMGGSMDISAYADNIGAWNDITDNLEVVRASLTSSTTLMSGYNVLIQGGISPGNKTITNGETIIFGTNPYARIVLYTDVLENQNLAYNTRVLVHELGHAFNLGHPNEFGPSCNYRSMMYQSGHALHSYEVTLHDQYGLYMLHDNAVKSSSAELSISSKVALASEPTEYQIRTSSEVEVYSLDDLEHLAEYVVKGKILDAGENIHTRYSQYTKTGFEISEVYKGDLEAGEIIYIGEDYFKETNAVDGTETTFYFNGYTESIVGEEYVFFLVKKPSFDVYGLAYSTLSRHNLGSGSDLRVSSRIAIDSHTGCDGEGASFTKENYSEIKEKVSLKYQ